MTDDIPRTIQVPLTKGFITVVDECDADLANYKWHTLLCRSRAYATRRVYQGENPGRILMHRLVMERVLEHPLEKELFVDHIDNDPLNNTRNNLRPATNSQNLSNRTSTRNSLSGVKGVYWHKATQSWVAKITVNNKSIYIGRFASIEDAKEAYIAAARIHHGEFARWE